MNQVDLRVSRTKYVMAVEPPYIYFSSSSKVARSINPDVRVEETIEEAIDLLQEKKVKYNFDGLRIVNHDFFNRRSEFSCSLVSR